MASEQRIEEILRSFKYRRLNPREAQFVRNFASTVRPGDRYWRHNLDMDLASYRYPHTGLVEAAVSEILEGGWIRTARFPRFDIEGFQDWGLVYTYRWELRLVLVYPKNNIGQAGQRVNVREIRIKQSGWPLSISDLKKRIFRTMPVQQVNQVLDEMVEEAEAEKIQVTDDSITVRGDNRVFTKLGRSLQGLRKRVIKLAYGQPELRIHLLPLLKKGESEESILKKLTKKQMHRLRSQHKGLVSGGKFDSTNQALLKKGLVRQRKSKSKGQGFPGFELTELGKVIAGK